MTGDEAKQAAMSGKSVRCVQWRKNSYVAWDGKKFVVDEVGNRIGPTPFGAAHFERDHVWDTHEPIVYIPPMWCHNRAVVRRKEDMDNDQHVEFVLRRMRLGASLEESSVEIIPMSYAMGDPKGWEDTAQCVPLARIIGEFEKVRIMSVAKAPL